MASNKVLVTGPSRSGKSEWAEHLARSAENRGKSIIYIATATVDPHDEEWQERIERHQQRRPPHWQTRAVPIAISETLHDAREQECLLIDSLGTWLANLLDRDDEEWQELADEFLFNLQHAPADVILVAEETGWGVVPAYPLGRTFRDRLGSLIRRSAAIADTTYLVAGGHVLNLTDLGKPLADNV